MPSPVLERSLGAEGPAGLVEAVPDLVGQGQAQGAQVQVLGHVGGVVGVGDHAQGYHWKNDFFLGLIKQNSSIYVV